jgi:hypothetical protein
VIREVDGSELPAQEGEQVSHDRPRGRSSRGPGSGIAP